MHHITYSNNPTYENQSEILGGTIKVEKRGGGEGGATRPKTLIKLQTVKKKEQKN